MDRSDGTKSLAYMIDGSWSVSPKQLKSLITLDDVLYLVGGELHINLRSIGIEEYAVIDSTGTLIKLFGNTVYSFFSRPVVQAAMMVAYGIPSQKGILLPQPKHDEVFDFLEGQHVIAGGHEGLHLDY